MPVPSQEVNKKKPWILCWLLRKKNGSGTPGGVGGEQWRVLTFVSS